MNPLRLFLLAALVLVVFGIISDDVEAEDPLWIYDTEAQIDAVAISADGERIAVGNRDDDGKLFLFDKDSSEPLWNYTIGDMIYSVDISADGGHIVVGSNNDNIYLFDKDNSNPLWNYTTGGNVYSVAISADGEYMVALNGGNGELSLFSKSNSTPLWSYNSTSSHWLEDIAISANGESVVVGYDDKKVYLFDKDGTFLWSDTGYASIGGDVEAVAISADGEYVAVSARGSNNDLVYFFGKDSSTPLWIYETYDNVLSYVIDISADGEYIVAGFTSKQSPYFVKACLFRKDDNKPLWVYETEGSSNWWLFDAVTISAGGEYITVSSGDKISLFLNNLLPTSNIFSITPSPAIFDTEVSFSGTGVDSDGTVVAYRWNSSLDGVLSTEANFSSSTLSLGLHTITLQVQDDDGEWSNETSKMLYIGTPPVALANDIGWNDEEPKNKVKPGDTAIFKGGGNDEDGTIVLYEWDFNGDGEFDWSSKETGSTTFVYIKEGTYNTTLRVTDNDGFTDTDYRLITVSEDDGDGGGGSIPSISLITSLISIGLLAIFRRK